MVEYEIAKKSIRELLELQQIKNVSIYKSAIPIRFWKRDVSLPCSHERRRIMEPFEIAIVLENNEMKGLSNWASPVDDMPRFSKAYPQNSLWAGIAAGEGPESV